MTTEHFAAIWSRVRSVTEPGRDRFLGITSTLPGEGVSSTVLHMGHLAAGSRQSVLLIDANLKRPALHRALGGRRAPGLTEVVAGLVDWKEALQPIDAWGLTLLSAGVAAEDLSTNADLAHLRELRKEWSQQFDLVLFDLPAVSDGGVTLPLAADLDGMLLVVEAGRTTFEQAQRAKEMLDRSRARLLGVTLNKERPRKVGGMWARSKW